MTNKRKYDKIIYTTAMLNLFKEEDLMNLREQFTLSFDATMEEMDEVFSGPANSKFEKIEQSSEFQKRITDSVSNLNKFVELIGGDDSLKNVFTREFIREHVRLNVMVNAISMMARKIVFGQGQSISRDEILVGIVDEKFVFLILDGTEETLKSLLNDAWMVKKMNEDFEDQEGTEWPGDFGGFVS